MPLFTFKCEKCSKIIKKILEQDPNTIVCKCGSNASREFKAPSSRVTEVIDNGIMPRRIELLSDIKRITRERSEKHDRDMKEDDKS